MTGKKNFYNIFSTDSKPFGFTLGEWTAKWWQWIITIPKVNNPGNDLIGEHCGINQEGPVWFLAGTFENIQKAERNCIIPKEKAILIPVINTEKSYIEFPELKDESALRTRAKEAIDRVTKKICIINGEEIQDLHNFRIQSPLFDLTYPQDNIYDLKPNKTQAVSDGFWVLFKPSEDQKKYKVEFGGESRCQKDQTEFETYVKYNIDLA